MLLVSFLTGSTVSPEWGQCHGCSHPVCNTRTGLSAQWHYRVCLVHRRIYRYAVSTHDQHVFNAISVLFDPESASLLFFFCPSLSPFPLSASWAVMSYPEIQSVVLDASFDDLLPLALKVMPDSWSESERFMFSLFFCFGGSFIWTTNVSLFCLRTISAAHSQAIHEPQQRRTASQVSLLVVKAMQQSQGLHHWALWHSMLVCENETRIPAHSDTCPCPPADTRDQSCWSGEPETR